MTLSGPVDAVDGTAFTENVTVTDHGPSNAIDTATTLLVPAGLTVTAAPGGAVHSGTIQWSDPSLVSGKSVVCPVTFQVGAHHTELATLGAVTEGTGYDANPANNTAITNIQLLPSAP